MINRDLVKSRAARVAIAMALWGGVATLFVYQYRHASKETAAMLETATARSEGLEALLADDHYGVIDVNADGIITNINPGAELIIGKPEADVVGQHVGAVICGEISAKLAKAFSVRRNDANASKVEVQNCDMVGSAVPVRCRMYASEAKNGDIVGLVLVDPQANVKITE